MKSAIATAVVVMLLVSCVTVNPPTYVSRGSGWYTVKRSDTLYSIAWRYGLDYKQLARWNKIDLKAPIHPGQRLRLLNPGNQAVASSSAQKSSSKTNTRSKPKPKFKPKSKVTATSKNDQSSKRHPVKWIWPTQGKPLNTFLVSKLDRRGIDIAGKSGQPVRAVADGKVVYSGNGLVGYGNLIIIKHSETYLSAYAYCQERLVEEGTLVKAGKVIAKMGRRDNIAKLHFEIRRNGKPVDPMKYLPNQ
jgi:lipoprotein NlpD